MMGEYPLAVDDQRDLPDDYSGPLFVWDVDKTYLSTHFSSLKGLSRIPLEFAVDKAAIPGMPEVLRGLRKGVGPDVACSPLYFISASPVQLREVLEHKMLLDGVEYDGIILKDWFKTIASLRPGRLKENLGYKLNALLSCRLLHPMAEEYLFGDDVEDDAEAFYLYNRILTRKISPVDLDERLSEKGVKRDDRLMVKDKAEDLPRKRGRVKRAFIHLQLRTPPERFKEYGRLVVPVRGACQLSLALDELDLVGPDTVRRACKAVRSALREGEEALTERIEDALARHLISREKYEGLNLEI